MRERMGSAAISNPKSTPPHPKPIRATPTTTILAERRDKYFMIGFVVMLDDTYGHPVYC
jgi:hypothetical protein